MKNVLLHGATKLKNNIKSRKRWRRLVRTLGIVVVFCTTYALILPAITMEGKLICDTQEHVHSGACYEMASVASLECGLDDADLIVHSHDGNCYDRGALICTLPEVVAHSHGEDCYALSGPVCAYVHEHDENCTGVQESYVCGIEEGQVHVHGESCAVTESILLCSEEESASHSHGDECWAAVAYSCGLDENVEHIHAEACISRQEKVCELTANEGHEHEDACYETELVCSLDELQLHVHEDACYAVDGSLRCTLPVVKAHQHSESCRVDAGQTMEVLSCGLEEHIHGDKCYPAESEADVSEYLCGMGVHTHGEGCLVGENGQTCSIPEHEHSAACLVDGVDTSADIELPEQWESSFAGLTLTGNWADDLVNVARTQLGYTESTRNIILDEGQLRGYTRYGEKYGAPYADWSAMFVSFCLDYAGVEDFTLAADCAQSILQFAQQQLLITADDYEPAIGDLVFLDTDLDGEADCAGITAEQLSDTAQWKFIAGDDVIGCVEYKTYGLEAQEIVGWCALPENPMPQEQLSEAAAVAAAIEALPTAEEAGAQLLALNEDMDREAYDAYLEEILAAVAEARAAYEALAEDQKPLAGDTTVLDELDKLCAEAQWQQLPAMDSDDGFISQMTAKHGEDTEIVNLRTALLGFTVEMETYSEALYGEVRVKLEFVLPVSEDKAAFVLEDMAWLEEAALTTETRLIGGEETVCQVLTGYKRACAESMTASIVPGSFTESVAVKPLAMENSEKLWVQINAALEHNTWDGVCESHQITEKLSVDSQPLTVTNLASEEEIQACYEELLAEFNALEEQGLDDEALAAAGSELRSKISEKYMAGLLDDEAFHELAKLADTMVYGDLSTVAEACVGTNWMLLRDSGWFEEYNNSVAYAETSAYSVMRSAAPAALATAAADPASAVQIKAEGGYEVSQPDQAVQVGKTIAGTDIENVFDITLEVFTQDEVTEVYKEPDMAVVIVMDISNSMNSNFGSTTRYKAAMTAAENFIKQFAANNLGASTLGFVAFNSDAHQIFAMSQCSNETQANALISTMRTQTGNIVNASGYAADPKRFTNIEAGLKRGKALLDTVTNKNKYIVFLSDGFPTTYISSGYTGYATNTSRFYDSVEKFDGDNRPCWGTDYSNEAAIRARTMATSIKSAGVTIFSTGVDIGGQTIQQYVDKHAGKSWTTVDRRNTNYEIGSATDPAAFKNWLGNSIGSGYYYDSENSAGLTNAFNSIFQQIVEMNASSSHLDWVASDPMGNMGVHEKDAIEFIGFFDKSGTLVEGNLVGESKDGHEYENTASFNTDTNTISWDLKKSGYISQSMGNTTNYYCSLTYRVRLINEDADFVERQVYETNDDTFLTYRIIEQTDNKVTVSPQRTVEFPKPAVEGYLSELSFTKTNSTMQPLPGAKFTLSHDTASCGYCRGDGKSSVELMAMEAESGEDGTVSFTNIPSGHSYILEETYVPTGHRLNGNSYKVTVAYDSLTVTVTGPDGGEVEWNEFIENYTEYSLPSTGGNGTTLIYTLGLLMVTAAVFMYGFIRGRKRRREAEQ